DRTVRLWDVRTGKELACFRDQPGGVWRVALSGDGKRALTSAGMYEKDGSWARGTDFTIRLWDADAGRELRQFPGHRGEVRGLAFCPGGRQVVSAGMVGTVRVWDVGSGKEVRSIHGHTGAIMSMALSQDGRRALTGGVDRTVRIWEVETGKELHC